MKTRKIDTGYTEYIGSKRILVNQTQTVTQPWLQPTPDPNQGSPPALQPSAEVDLPPEDPKSLLDYSLVVSGPSNSAYTA